MVQCCPTSTETVDLLWAGAQDGHLDFHTAPELCSVHLLRRFSTALGGIGGPLLNTSIGLLRLLPVLVMLKVLLSLCSPCVTHFNLIIITVRLARCCWSRRISLGRVKGFTGNICINPFTAPACKHSGLKSAHLHAANSLVDGPITNLTFSTVHFNRSHFTCSRERRKKF